MVYLEEFRFPGIEKEERFLCEITTDSTSPYFNKDVYPFRVLSNRSFYCIDFEPITILYGGNGSGKSTALNVIARKLKVPRNSPYNNSEWFDEYTKRCSFHTDTFYSGEEFTQTGIRQAKYDISTISKMLTSDDIFTMMHDNRVKCDQRLHKSKVLFDRCMTDKRSNGIQPRHLYFETGEDVQEFCDFVDRRTLSFNQYAQKHIGAIERNYSNGENSLIKLSDFIQNEGLYLLDEPENSLSCEFQLKLKQIIEYAARYCKAQFVIATHSPFLLALEGAKIYSLDDIPVSVKKWWELDSVKTYFEFFESNRDKFTED